MAYVTLTKENIRDEHICRAFSDKKYTESYELKKRWLSVEFENGYVFRRLDERAKVFIEYGPAENAWVPVTAPDYLMIGCFRVSGKYKATGHGKALLNDAIEDARVQGKRGLVMVAGTKKFHFMSDTRWLLGQGFEIVESLSLKPIKIETLEQARTCPSPATIFSLFLDSKFVATDISACMDSRFDKVVGRVV